MLAEAGTGVGKTLGYLAPASLWAERTKGRPLGLDLHPRPAAPDRPRERAPSGPTPPCARSKAVVRKGRENYLCLLNLQDMVQAAQLGNGDLIGMGLAAAGRVPPATAT